jgi:hypothetical protein
MLNKTTSTLSTKDGMDSSDFTERTSVKSKRSLTGDDWNVQEAL